MIGMTSLKRSDDTGAMGVGTLILFISVVLVSAVAAGVLIDTANKLQQQAEKTGDEAIREVSSGIKVENVYGVNYPTEDMIDYATNSFTWSGSASSDDYNIEVSSDDTTQNVTVGVGQDLNEVFEVKITDYDQVVPEGENVTMNYRIKNVGKSSSTQDINLHINHTGNNWEKTDTAKSDLDLDPGETYYGQYKSPGLENGVGDYILGLYNSGSPTTNNTVTVRASSDPSSVTKPNFEVNIVDYDLRADTDEEVEVKYRVKNTGDISGTQDIEFNVSDSSGTEVYSEKHTGITLNSNRGEIEEINMMISLAAGAEPQDLSRTLVKVYSEDSVVSLQADEVADFEHYGWESNIKQEGEEDSPYIGSGDKYEITIDLTAKTRTDEPIIGALEPQDDLSIQIVPKHGEPTREELIVPSTITDDVIIL